MLTDPTTQHIELWSIERLREYARNPRKTTAGCAPRCRYFECSRSADSGFVSGPTGTQFSIIRAFLLTPTVMGWSCPWDAAWVLKGRLLLHILGPVVVADHRVFFFDRRCRYTRGTTIPSNLTPERLGCATALGVWCFLISIPVAMIRFGLPT
jgi:hypothetical protein